MFYTLISKLPILSNQSNRKFLKVFILGSVMYLLLHYWLYSDVRFEFLEKLKGYIYYVMCVDMCVGWWFSRAEPEEESEDKSYTPEQRADIMNNLQEMRKMQLARQQMMQIENKNDQADKVSTQTPFVKKDAEKSKDQKEKEKDSSSHNSKTKKHSTETPKKTNEKTKGKEKESDTQFPVFMGNDE